MKKKIIVICCTILMLLIIVGGVYYFWFNSDENVNLSSVNSIDSSVDTDDGDEDIDWSMYDETDISLSDSITITEEGVYNLTGTISNGCISINTEGNVKLNLNNVTITNNSGPAIFVSNASDVVIEISGNNTLEDGTSYSGYEDGEDGVIFSHDDLTLQGSGTLNIIANYQDGIVSKDDLKIVNGTYNIESADDGIRGKDSVYILDGTFVINALGDGIKATNDTDDTKGFIKILDGNFEIDADLDGIQAETKLIIENGTFDITTGGGASNSSSSSSNWGTWGRGYNNSQSSSDTSDSAKGLKASGNIVISAGTFNFDTSDDAVHSNDYIGISGGNFTISTGDDGIHADTGLVIDDGKIIINKSYEGIESASITINGGNCSIYSSDDGINVAGGNDSSSMGRVGANNFSDTNNILTINGGTIYVNSTGDGIDVNGSAYINGGTITVDGPSDSGNGAIDYDSAFEINGGTFIAAGASGMAQSASSGSEQYNVIIYFTSSYSSDDVITIVDSDENVIMTYSGNKTYNCIVYSSSELKSGSTYTIKVNGESYQSFKVSSKCMSVGSSNNGMNNNNQNNKRR